jgi:putative ribosome biogenesis GTPase RsgA
VERQWAFDIKRNGAFKPRIVACGYVHVTGEDLNEIYTPVTINAPNLILIICLIVNKLDSRILDKVTVLLYGHMEENNFPP